MATYQGLPGPHICDFWEREASAANYDDGSTFQIGRIDMVANTGTYVDSPFHRYADGKDLAGLPLESLAELDGIVVRRPFEAARDRRGAISRARSARPGGAGPHRLGPPLADRCLLADHPFLTEAAADGWPSKARRWSASTATISTTRASARGRCTRMLLGAESRSASI